MASGLSRGLSAVDHTSRIARSACVDRRERYAAIREARRWRGRRLETAAFGFFFFGRRDLVRTVRADDREDTGDAAEDDASNRADPRADVEPVDRNFAREEANRSSRDTDGNAGMFLRERAAHERE